MFLLVTQRDGEYDTIYDNVELNTMDDVVDYLDDNGSIETYYALYEYTVEHDFQAIQRVREARKEAVAVIRTQALAKLTPEEKRALGF